MYVPALGAGGMSPSVLHVESDLTRHTNPGDTPGTLLDHRVKSALQFASPTQLGATDQTDMFIYILKDVVDHGPGDVTFGSTLGHESLHLQPLNYPTSLYNPEGNHYTDFNNMATECLGPLQ
jgi:hypothetical protein